MYDLTDLQTYLGFQSVSTLSDKKPVCRETAEWLAQYLAGMGLTALVMETEGNPVVYATLGDDPGKKTILVYGHYDVQPAEPLVEWGHEPWKGEITGGAIWGRGTSDNKGQFWCHVLAIREWQQQGKALPVNLKFLIEGEEEVGSTSMEKFIWDNVKLLNSDIVWISDGSATADGSPTIDAGLRGTFSAQLKVMGPKQDLHSGSYGGAIDNPVNTLSGVLFQLSDSAGVVKVPGFYDAVTPISDASREVIKGEKYDEAEFLARTGSVATAGEAGYSVAERLGLRPTMQVTGISGGYTGEGFKNIVPKSATAKINFRLAHGQDWRETAGRVKEYVGKIMPPGVSWEWEVDSGNNAYLADPASSVIKVARTVFSKVFGRESVVRFGGASLPVTNWFAQDVTPQVLLSGWAGEMHVVDEHLSLESLAKGVEAITAYWQAVS